MNGKRLIFGIAFALLATLGATSCGSKPEISEIPEGALILDVRTAREFRGDRYPGAINVPLRKLAARVEELGDKDRTIVVYCRSGNRSVDAKEILLARGFTNVKNGAGLDDMLAMPRATKEQPDERHP